MDQLRRIFWYIGFGFVALIIAFFLIIILIQYTAHSTGTPTTTATSTPGTASSTYSSRIYGFAFSYPTGFTVHEYTPERIAFGTGTGSDFRPLVEAVVVTPDASDPTGDFEGFIRVQAQLTCDADGPNGSSHCPSVSSTLPFTAATGVTGEILGLSQTSTVKGKTATSTVGPYYVFNISANVNAARFAGLMLYPVPANAGQGTGIALTKALADTMTLSKVSLGDNSSWQAGMQVITRKDQDLTINLKKNERFVIQLGTTMQWTLNFTPPTIIVRVPNSTTANGVQGIFEATKTGITTMTATGAPICKTNQACPQYLVLVRVILDVR